MNIVQNRSARRPLLLFVHGWGFGPGMWRSVLHALPGWRHHTLDLGFFGTEKTQIQSDSPVIGVGHSLGFLWLLHHMGQTSWGASCVGLVSIAGFSRFSRGENFPHGMALSVLQRMMRRLPQQPDTVLTEFRQRGGWRGRVAHCAGADVTRLSQGLAWLQRWDERAVLATWERPLVALAAEQDKIVPPALTTACFPPAALHWLKEGGHLLPLTHPEVCAQTIRMFGERMA